MPNQRNFGKARGEATYRLSEDASAPLLNPSLWSNRSNSPSLQDLKALLYFTTRSASNKTISANELEDLLSPVCVLNGKIIGCADSANTTVWSTLLEIEKRLIFSAFEIPAVVNKQRQHEAVRLDSSINPHGVSIIKAFVAASAKRAAGQKPRIAFVTASSADAYDAVDFYTEVLRQAGAEPYWWPIDSSMNDAIFTAKNCNNLAQSRIEKSMLLRRDVLYPDLFALQKTACENPGSLANFPSQMHGIFFAGGDQSLVRQTFYDHLNQPNSWLLNLQRAFATGDLVIGGTSAGTAVQSGSVMLSNGTSANAVMRSAKHSAPPAEGCQAANRCPIGLLEDDLTYWTNGGLNLAGNLLMDTHFSERARELRLLQLMHDANVEQALGVDETSALHLSWLNNSLHIEAIGAHGGWWFSMPIVHRKTGKISANVHYIAPGKTFALKADGLHLLTPAAKLISTRLIQPEIIDALQDTALREAAGEMATNGQKTRAFRAKNTKGQLSLTQESQTWMGPQGQIGITDLLLELDKP